MSASRHTEQRVSGGTRAHPSEKFYPAKARMFFALTGSTVLFLSLAFIYLVTLSRQGLPPGFEFPRSFTLGTVLLMSGSLCVAGLTGAFRRDEAGRLRLGMSVAMATGLAFCVVQGRGISQVWQPVMADPTNTGTLFLLLAVVIQMLHAFFGVLYLAIISLPVFRMSSDPVRKLLYFSNDVHFSRIQLLSVYWHYNTAVWVLMFLTFLFTI